MGAMDSSADLLFRISADSSDAQGNIQRFRALMSKDLGDLKAEFGDWATKVFGNLGTVGGALTGVTATLAASVVAVGGAMVKAASDAARYAEEIEDGVDKTGMSAEAMSGLRYVAKNAELGYGDLVTSIVRFESTIAKAQDPTSKQAKLLHDLGISQGEIKAGTQDLLPLLYRVSDVWRDHADGVTKTAAARELFSRGGAQLNEFLNMGSERMRRLTQEAVRLGLVLSEDDLMAAKAFRLELEYLHAQQEALWLSIGQKGIPLMTYFAVGVEGVIGGINRALKAGGGLTSMVTEFTAGLTESTFNSVARLQDRIRGAMAEGSKGAMPGFGEQVKQGTEDFRGLTSILDQLKMRLADTRGEEARLAAEFARGNEEIIRAGQELKKLQAEHKVAPEAVRREMAALVDLPRLLMEVNDAAFRQLNERRAAQMASVNADLQQRLQAQQEQTHENRVQLWDDEITKLTARLAKERLLTADNERLIAALRKEGLDRLTREANEAFASELRSLQQALSGMVAERMTSLERIRWAYDLDLERYSAVEEAKAKMAAATDAQREAIARQFELNRAAAYARMHSEITTLYNSQGWQGVFGQAFAAAIRNNEALLREWAESSNQSLLMTRVAVESLKEMGKQAFRDFSQAMGQNIAQSIVYSQSVGEAMQAALASTLESIAAQSFVQAIYATALGFLRLAMWDFAGAANAFTAAAIFGTVGAAAAIAGRAVAPKHEKGGAAAEASGTGSAGSSAGAESGAGEPGGQGGPRITINVQGHVIGQSGVEELTDMINEAVQGRDVRLVATAVRQAQRVTA